MKESLTKDEYAKDTVEKSQKFLIFLLVENYFHRDQPAGCDGMKSRESLDPWA